MIAFIGLGNPGNEYADTKHNAGFWVVDELVRRWGISYKPGKGQYLYSEKIKGDFPLLEREVNGKPIVYLDSAATSQKPVKVIDRMTDYYKQINANVHRGAYQIAELATSEMEETRAKVSRFINASSEKEIVFTKNATEAINLVAYTWARSQLNDGDVILLSSLEHHSNIVPWQQLSSERNIEIRWIPITQDGQLDLSYIDKLLENVKLLCVSAVSNALGTINPVKQLADAAHKVGAICLVDACQSVPHFETDVEGLGADFLAFSGHKMCGPTGVGVLWGRLDLIEKMPPFLGGGEMILKVTFEETTYNELPHKFEAGTPNIAGAIGLRNAIDYLSNLNLDMALKHEMSIHDYALNQLLLIPNIEIIGTATNKSSIISFIIKDLHPHDIGTILNQKAVAVRTGHHCTMPLMDHYQIPGTIRSSFSFYNTIDEVDVMIEALDMAINMLS